MQEIIKKLRFKSAGVVVNAPEHIEKEFVKLGFVTAMDATTKSKDTIVFVYNHTAFIDFLSKQLKNVETDSVLWFAYPKSGSGIETDINRDKLKAMSERFDITTVTAISIDDTWSALRFRPRNKVGKK